MSKDIHEQSELSPEALRGLRKIRRESQTRFWKRFGVTQSRGSRFEQGMEIPSPVKILIRLYMEGIVKERDLQQARRNTNFNVAITE
jgi:DNA-binding transcriptional regulator YiaG